MEDVKSETADEAKKTIAQDAAAVQRMLEAFGLMPLHALAEGRNQSIPSLLHELTGLSKARISQGGLDQLRPSTLSKVEEHQQRWLEDELVDPQAIADARARIATSPKTRSGKHGPWTDWVHQFEAAPHVLLPLSKAIALTVDELLEVLVESCDDDDLSTFKQALLDHIGYHGAAVRIGEDPPTEPAAESEWAELQAIEDWSQAANFTRHLVDALYWDIITALDAEWNSHYFSGRQTSPLYPLVMVRAHSEILEGRMPPSRRSLFLRPSRRLLESLYALAFFCAHKAWPEKPPSPQDLADILFKPEVDEMLSNSDVSNYFDGSTKLTLDLAYDHWVQMVRYFMPDRKAEQRPHPPYPMIMLALQWQALLVQDKGKSFFLPDLEQYNRLWRHRRQQWEKHPSSQETFARHADHQKGEPLDWPAWALNQSSS